MLISDELQAVATIIRQLRDELSTRSSPVIVSGTLDVDMSGQSTAILTEVFVELRALDPSLPQLVSVDYSTPASVMATATLGADQNLHPGEALVVGEALFGIALPVVSAVVLERNPHADQVIIARTLHHAVWRRFPPGAVAYVEILRARLSSAHQDSRRRLALDLHDRIAHGIVAGLQRVELAGLDGTASSAARDDLSNALVILRNTLDDVQGLALELRQRVGDRPFQQAILDFVADVVDLRPALSVDVRGDPWALTASVAEEAFTIVLEAIRNARNHAAEARTITLVMDWASEILAIQVEDDGRGFDPEKTRTGGIGLEGMRERAESIGADLEVSSAPSGTTVTLRLRREPVVAR